MISGKLPNNTVWWLSRDGQKIWIESEDIEQERFKQKNCNISHGRIFHARKEVGELTTSRLDSRMRKDAWIIKLEAMLYVYPELEEEINRKSIEEKKKKKTKESPKYKKDIFKEQKNIINIKNNKEITDNNKEITDNNKEILKSYFDITYPYITWIKEEISKNENGKIVILLKDLKEKMGEEYINMHDMRIYFGLNKILPSIGIIMELKSVKGDSIAILKKTV